MSQEVQSELKPPSQFVKVWEGSLDGLRQGQSIFITKLEGYRRASTLETIAANWPPVMQIIRLISEDDVNHKQYAGKVDFFVFRATNPPGFLSQLHEKKMCAVIQLPTQTLLLFVSNIASRLIGMLLPKDMVVFTQSSQEQQLMQQQQQQQMQLQQQHIPQLPQQQLQQQQLSQLQQQLSQLQLALLQQQHLTQLQQQQLTQLQLQLSQMQLTQLQHTQLQQQVSLLLPPLQQLQQLVQGPGRLQLVFQRQVSSQGSTNIGGEEASMI